MTSFEELGLSGPLLEAVRRQGWDAPTALQDAAFAVLRRGGNAVLWASPGAGVVGAYALPLLAALTEAEGDAALAAADGRTGPRVLVLVPTPDRAEHVARAIADLALGSGILVATPSPGWPAAGRAHVVVADPPAAAGMLARSALKLGEVTAFVVEGADALAGDRGPALEAVVTALPPPAQRVVAAGRDDPDTRALVERLAPKAIGVPSRSEMAQAKARPVAVQYAVVPDRERPAALGRIVEAAGVVVVHCRSAARAAKVADSLAARGFGREIDGASVRVGGTPAPGEGTAVSYDVPSDAATFAARHENGGVVLLAARELQHAERAAGAAGIELVPRAAHPAEDAGGELGAFRESVRRALREEDLAAQTLVLAPLVEEHGPLRVAAALSALARTRPRASGPEAETGSTPATPHRREVASASAPPPPALPAFTRLFLSVGRKDGAGPGDIVGAIAGETGVAGDRIGRIELGETHTIAEVASDDARRVIDGLNGTTIRGRAVRVDFDRPRRGRPERRARGPGPG